MKLHRGNLYCYLVETKDNQLVSKMSCRIWQSDLDGIRRTFAKSGLDLDFEDGSEVAIRCRVEFHDVYGLSLRGVAMDPTFALGTIERRRREILERLSNENLLERNRRHHEPLIANRIGVVVSRDTAGYADFVETLRKSALPISVWVADARVQGTESEASILRALNKLATCRTHLVVIIRGGGSRLDLSHLDNEAVARRIAGYPVPIWTGIGHETDRSVLDEVAARSFKTPTAVAKEIIDRLEALDRTLALARRSLKATIRQLVTPQKQQLQTLSQHFPSRACSMVRRRRERLNALATRGNSASAKRLSTERHRLSSTGRELSIKASGRLRVDSQTLIERTKSLSKTVARFQRRQRELLAQLRQRLRGGALPARVTAARQQLDSMCEAHTSRPRRRLEQARSRLERQRSILSIPRARLSEGREALRSHKKSLQKTSLRLISSQGEMLTIRAERLVAPTIRTIDAQRTQAGLFARQLMRASESMLRVEQTALKKTRARFRAERLLQRLAIAERMHRDWERALRANDPQRVLERGYSLTYTEDGQLLQSVESAQTGAKIWTRVRDGEIVSVVESTTKEKT